MLNWIWTCIDFRGFGSNDKAQALWKCVVLWVLWLERNARIFEGREDDIERMWENMFFGFFWVQVAPPFKGVSLSLSLIRVGEPFVECEYVFSFLLLFFSWWTSALLPFVLYLFFFLMKIYFLLIKKKMSFGKIIML